MSEKASGTQTESTTLSSERLAAWIKDARVSAANLRSPALSPEASRAATLLSQIAHSCVEELMLRGDEELIPQEPEHLSGGRALTMPRRDEIRIHRG